MPFGTSTLTDTGHSKLWSRRSNRCLPVGTLIRPFATSFFHATRSSRSWRSSFVLNTSAPSIRGSMRISHLRFSPGGSWQRTEPNDSGVTTSTVCARPAGTASSIRGALVRGSNAAGSPARLTISPLTSTYADARSTEFGSLGGVDSSSITAGVAHSFAIVVSTSFVSLDGGVSARKIS